VIFAVLFALTMRRGASDPVCGMRVDRGKAVRMEFAGETFYFCSEHCAHAFEVDPAEDVNKQPTPTEAKAAGACAHD
jgi:P-type Cu+ transporter